jgi:hypothetical protein
MKHDISCEGIARFSIIHRHWIVMQQLVLVWDIQNLLLPRPPGADESAASCCGAGTCYVGSYMTEAAVRCFLGWFILFTQCGCSAGGQGRLNRENGGCVCLHPVFYMQPVYAA